MGMFPYECVKCGGAFRRCGQHHINCEGGQFCWEDNVFIRVDDKYYSGVYDGYGKVITDQGKIFVPSQFNEFIPNWFLDLNYDWKNTKISIWCESCFKNKLLN